MKLMSLFKNQKEEKGMNNNFIKFEEWGKEEKETLILLRKEYGTDYKTIKKLLNLKYHNDRTINAMQYRLCILNKKNKLQKPIVKDNDVFTEALQNFKIMRKQKKKPMTKRAEELLLIRLGNLSNNKDEQIEILNQSIVNCWQGVFPLNGDNYSIINNYNKQDTSNIKDTSKNNKIMIYKNDDVTVTSDIKTGAVTTQYRHWKEKDNIIKQFNNKIDEIIVLLQEIKK
jgi:hypothetical protein